MKSQRRCHERKHSRLPVWVRHVSNGAPRQGHCANISDGGAYVLMSNVAKLSIGDGVELTIGIQSDDHNGFDLHRSTHSAQVLRMECLGYATGVALQFSECFARVETNLNLVPA